MVAGVIVGAIVGVLPLHATFLRAHDEHRDLVTASQLSHAIGRLVALLGDRNR